jgi:hypothetical protein
LKTQKHKTLATLNSREVVICNYLSSFSFILNFIFDYEHNKQFPGFSAFAEKKVKGSVHQDGEGVESRLS